MINWTDIAIIAGTAAIVFGLGYLTKCLTLRLRRSTPPPLDLPREGYRPRFLNRL